MLASFAFFFFIDDEHIEKIFPGWKNSCDAYSFHMSDHPLIWIQIKIDIEGFLLNQIAQHR